jgi:hypothetical protein
MESGFIVRTAGRATQASGTRSGGTSVRGAVPASLSAAQSVTAVEKPAEARVEDSASVPKLVVDAESRETIQQVLDVARRLTGQAREDTKQRLRAYVRRTSARREPKDHLDVEV